MAFHAKCAASYYTKGLVYVREKNFKLPGRIWYRSIGIRKLCKTGKFQTNQLARKKVMVAQSSTSGVLLACDSERYAGMHIASKKEIICQISVKRRFKAWRIRNFLPFFRAGT